ncbi:DUF2924 domain-containing protein [Leptolyngbya sp. 15MV]|nr:DUF2924 domain-containing protein [Leptolyngbya sp. 15MV]
MASYRARSARAVAAFQYRKPPACGRPNTSIAGVNQSPSRAARHAPTSPASLPLDRAVTVLPHGFEYEGKTYRSLSAVATAITGSHWNGFLFFGLTKKGTA